MIVVVTGADGFIGTAACKYLESVGHVVRRVVRSAPSAIANRYAIGDIGGQVDWTPVLIGADAILHLAARAHIMRDRDPAAAEAAFLRSNVSATERLVLAAADYDVPRIVFLSSIGVNGAETIAQPFRESDSPAPVEAYARSKLQAEILVRETARERGMQAVIVRPPLVYGPGAKGNFLRMLRLAKSGVPLPLASIRNRRNLIGLRNLCEALRLCLEHVAAIDQTFLIAEPRARSTPEIFSTLYGALRIRNRLFPCPEAALHATTKLLGLHAQFSKLCGSLEIDSSKAQNVLGWKPIESFDNEIARTVEWFERDA